MKRKSLQHDETMFDFLDEVTRRPWSTGLPFIDFAVDARYLHAMNYDYINLLQINGGFQTYDVLELYGRSGTGKTEVGLAVSFYQLVFCINYVLPDFSAYCGWICFAQILRRARAFGYIL